ncbi:endonuclease [Peterkaempfera bronchialis]|uniref:Endonuclease n=1 Tax=Peterkaempfera bronchialis TaxID=2126346 RepID=A0A345T0M5_9ACTN|nr:endonuclease [Peterkaempfera bronchialis]AXI79530.1 endonuclease [Peterkaempfera bronchialis]
MTDRETVDRLVRAHGRTYAADAGIRLRDSPGPLYELLVLSELASTRIRAEVAVAAARALFAAGMRSPERMREASWQQRVDALGEGGYRRYDESTATRLGDGAQLLLDRWKGDLRALHREAGDSVEALARALQEFPGIGPAGADIFLREVQGVWPGVAPYFGAKALQGADRLGLPADPAALTRLIGRHDPAAFAAALVRAALHKDVAEGLRASN